MAHKHDCGLMSTGLLLASQSKAPNLCQGSAECYKSIHTLISGGRKWDDFQDSVCVCVWMEKKSSEFWSIYTVYIYTNSIWNPKNHLLTEMRVQLPKQTLTAHSAHIIQSSNEFSASDRLYLVRPRGEHLKGTKRSSNFFLSPFRKVRGMPLRYQLIKRENETRCNIAVVTRADIQNMRAVYWQCPGGPRWCLSLYTGSASYLPMHL